MEMHLPSEQTSPSPQKMSQPPQWAASVLQSKQSPPQLIRPGSVQQPGGKGSTRTVTGAADMLVRTSCRATPDALGTTRLPARNTSWGGLKKVMRLEVSAADETVTSLANRD